MRLSILPLFLLLSACATVTSKSTQDITVTTEPTGASCELTNKDGSWAIESTPGTVAVQRSFSPLTVHCAGDSVSATEVLEPRTRGRAYGNILLFGLPAYVDAATEKGYEYAPATVHLTLANQPPAE